MARIQHRRLLLRLYDDVPRHQEILRWLDGYSGRGLQAVLCDALFAGLPQVLGTVPPEPSVPRKSPEPSLSLPRADTMSTGLVEQKESNAPAKSQEISVPEFLPSTEAIDVVDYQTKQDEARAVLRQLFQDED